MQILRLLDSPFAWGLAGLVVGFSLGVTSVSVWLVAVAIGTYLIYVGKHGPADHGSEGWLFSAGPAFMMSWVLGFILNGLVF